MEGTLLLHALRLTNFLSYGPEGEFIELQPLNVLIGPNGSGKSNLVEAIGLLKAAPTDLTLPIRVGGGMPEWPFKGNGDASPAIDIDIETVVEYPAGLMPLRYRFQIIRVGQRLELVDEMIENVRPSSAAASDVSFFYRYEGAGPVLSARTRPEDPEGSDSGRQRRSLRREELNSQQSVLSQRRDPDQYPEITYLADVFSRIAIFRECDLGRMSPLRGPQPADLPDDFLLEGGGNLGLVLNDLLNRPQTKNVIRSQLKRFYPFANDITTKIRANTVEIFLDEGDFHNPTPSTRFSGGTLRYLYLLAILCHPSPPPLVCIEDPEIALHPDALSIVAELLREASQRTQLIVTTHSDVLVSALSETPDAIVVCERDENGSHLRRLDPTRLQGWLEKYSLGDLWRMGEVGGNPC